MKPDGNEERPPLEGDPAFLLEEGISYVRAWSEAQHAVSALRRALTELGVGDTLPYLRADVTEFGSGIVELGRVTPETAELLASALVSPAKQRKKWADECAA
jgi:hypothetical protein